MWHRLLGMVASRTRLLLEELGARAAAGKVVVSMDRSGPDNLSTSNAKKSFPRPPVRVTGLPHSGPSWEEQNADVTGAN